MSDLPLVRHPQEAHERLHERLGLDGPCVDEIEAYHLSWERNIQRLLAHDKGLKPEYSAVRQELKRYEVLDRQLKAYDRRRRLEEWLERYSQDGRPMELLDLGVAKKVPGQKDSLEDRFIDQVRGEVEQLKDLEECFEEKLEPLRYRIKERTVQELLHNYNKLHRMISFKAEIDPGEVKEEDWDRYIETYKQIEELQSELRVGYVRGVGKQRTLPDLLDQSLLQPVSHLQ